MTGRQRLVVAVLILLGLLGLLLVLGFASVACPVETEAQPCPDATRNLGVAIGLASASVAILVTPFAFLGEVVSRRRIVYRGAWWRATRRGMLVGAALAALAALRLADVLNVPVAMFVIILAVVVEWFLARADA